MSERASRLGDVNRLSGPFQAEEDARSVDGVIAGKREAAGRGSDLDLGGPEVLFSSFPAVASLGGRQPRHSPGSTPAPWAGSDGSSPPRRGASNTPLTHRQFSRLEAKKVFCDYIRAERVPNTQLPARGQCELSLLGVCLNR